MYYAASAAGWEGEGWCGYPTKTFYGAPFLDVAEAAWYSPAVAFVYRNGLFDGVEDTVFAPEATMTRAMLATVLWRYAGSPEGGENPFTDVKNGLWYTEAVRWAASNEIVKGLSDGVFGPDEPLSRAQLVTILFRYAQKADLDTGERASLASFPDWETTGDWALEAMRWAVAGSILNGVAAGENAPVLLEPQGGATWAQVAAILMRFLQGASGE